jgi:hypothetical protein
MASCPAHTFRVTAEQFESLTEKANAAGIAIEGTFGSAAKDGITLEWRFDAGTEALTIQCTSAPAFVPCSMIGSRIQALVRDSLA